MRRRVVVVVLMSVALVLGAAGPAAAKGADQLTVSGPGLARPIVLGGMGEPGSGEQLGQLADGSGLFIALFGASGGVALSATTPPGSLGPAYEFAYRIPGGEAIAPIVRQQLYPAAPGGPVTFTPPGQSAYAGPIGSGWYRAPEGFARLLVAIGLPASVVDGASATPTTGAAAVPSAAAAVPPSTSDDRRWLAGGLAALAVVALLAGIAGLAWRRRATARA